MSVSKRKIKNNSWCGIEEDLVRGLYLGLLGREPDVSGMLYWIARIKAGDSIDEIALEVLHGDESRQRKRQGLFKQSYQTLCRCVAEWANQETSNTPLIIVDVSSQKLPYERQLYEQLSDYNIPHHVIAYGPLEYFRQEQGNLNNKLTLHPEFICDGNIHKFHLNEPEYSSSLLPFHPWIVDRLVDSSQFTTIRVDDVTTRTLDSAMKDMENIDLIKLNIHGMELVSLQNAVETLRRTEVVHCNISFIEMYQGQSRFNEVEQFLSEQGFDLVDFYDQRHYAFAGTSFSWSQDILGQVGAVFFRRLDINSPARSIVSQSLLALMVYKKPSLAAWIAKRLEHVSHPLAKLFTK